MANDKAKAVSLKVRPSQSVDLCFEVSGIIGEQNTDLAQLGGPVDAFPLDTQLYARLLDPGTDPTRPGLLKFDSTAIHSALTSGANGGPLLFALRAENVKAVMDKAINLRENSFYQKYARKNDVISRTLADYQTSTVIYTGNTTAGSNAVTNLSSTATLMPGFVVTGPGIPAATTIGAVTGPNTITLSANATATAVAVSLTCFAVKFSTPSAVAKQDRLDQLSSISDAQHKALSDAYIADPIRNPGAGSKGVVQTTTTDLVTFTAAIYMGDTTVGSNTITNMSSVANLLVGATVTGPGIPNPPSPAAPTTTIIAINGPNSVTLSANATATAAAVRFTFGGFVQTHSDTQSYNELAAGAPTSQLTTFKLADIPANLQTTADSANKLGVHTQTASTHIDSTTDATRQHTESKGYDFKFPSGDNDAQYQRAQISLTDERFSQFMFQQNLQYLPAVFDNELESIDLDVKRLQVSYVNTILISPIKGVVTGVFRDLGDCVQAGQPVMRVENNDSILVVGTLKYRGVLRVGTPVRFQTRLFDLPIPEVTVPAPPKPPAQVVAIRGHDSEDEQWDVIISCDNLDAAGKAIFPINYNFDFDDTTVIVNPIP